MDERMAAFRIGVMVLASILATAILSLLFAQGDFTNVFQLNKKFPIRIKFEEAPGVRENTPIQKSGIVIGRVAAVELVDDGRAAMVVARIDEGIKIFDDEICRINRSLLGDSVLEFIKVPGKGSGKEIELNGKPLEGITVPDPLQVVGNLEGNLARAISSVSDTSSKIGGLIDKFDSVLGSEQEVSEARDRLRRVFDKTYDTMDAIEQLASGVNEIMGDQESHQRLREAIDQIPEVIADVRTTFGGLNETLQLADANLRNMEGFTGALDEHGAQMLERLSSSAEKLDGVMDEVVVFSNSINTSQGSLGKFINDPELYDSLTRSARNFEDLTPQLRAIVRDIRVLSDEMARHPGMIIRDAVKPGAGTKGVPPLSRSRRQVELR
jgi:phospholipid/cholesterol/gamma-HCH transport system substrate-binding protein